MAQERSILPNIRQGLVNVAKAAGVTVEKLEEEFWLEYDDANLQGAGLSESLLQSAASQAVSGRYITNFDTETLSFFVLGFGNVRGKNPARECYVLPKGANPTIRRIMFRSKELCDIPTTFITEPDKCPYFENIKFGKFRSGDDMFAMNGTKYPVRTQYEADKVFSRISMPVITCSNAYKNPSTLQQNSTYSDSTDWRMIEGFVKSVRTVILEKSKLPSGVVDISDATSLENLEVMEDGSVKQNIITGWSDPTTIANIGVGSICKFYGSTSADAEKKVTMNLSRVIPRYIPRTTPPPGAKQ
jgi:hypothetical protein